MFCAAKIKKIRNYKIKLQNLYRIKCFWLPNKQPHRPSKCPNQFQQVFGRRVNGHTSVVADEQTQIVVTE